MNDIHEQRAWYFITVFITTVNFKHMQADFKCINAGKIKDSPHITCFCGDHLAFRAVAHKVGGNDVDGVVGAALQAADLTGRIDGVTAVDDAAAILGHSHIEKCTAVHGPSHLDRVGATFLHSKYILGGTRDWRREN